ncbi:MAG TPA: DUF6448 family protein [Thermoplasmata archaeon]
MPPHCDTLDGPVVEAARKALETGDVKFILPFAPKKAEEEITRAFERTLRARKLGKEAKDVADYWFFETVVRLHREGEGAPYTGLKPAGLDWGPLIPKAEKAIEKGNPDEVVSFMNHAVDEAVREKFNHAMKLKDYRKGDVDAARRYTSAMLGFELYTHHLYANIMGGGEHGEGGEGGERGHEH